MTLTCEMPETYVMVGGRGRRSHVWLWEGRRVFNIGMAQEFQSIAEARAWAGRFAADNGLVVVHADDLRAYRRRK